MYNRVDYIIESHDRFMCDSLIDHPTKRVYCLLLTMSDNPSSFTSNSKTDVGVLCELTDELDIMQCTEPDNDKPWRGWRYLPHVDADVMIISSYGEVYPPNVSVARKLVPCDSATDRLILARQEYDCILDLNKQDSETYITYCYTDHGSLQASKGYYLDRTKKLLMECKREAGKRYIIIQQIVKL